MHPIKRVLIKGIPHYTDGVLTLPIMAGGIDWEKYAKKDTKKKATPLKTAAIRSFEELNKRIPDWQQKSIQDIVLSGINIAPDFYKQLQDFMVKAEQEGFGPVNAISREPATLPIAKKFYDEGGVLPISDLVGGGGSGGVAAANPEEDFYWWQQQQNYAAELERQEFERRQAAQAEQDRIQREWEAQQAEIERQNRLRLQRLGDLTQLVGQFAGIQARARETLAGLQGDPFAFAGAKLGLAPSGVTPMQAFSGELSSFAGRPMPQVDPNAPLSAIEQQIMGLQGTMAPQAPKIFGMAGGGQVSGGQQTVLVGERGPEVVIGSEFKVLPLTGSGATGYDTSTLLPALSPLYAGLGLGRGTRAGTYPTGFTIERPHGMTARQSADALGYNPRLLRSEQSQEVYYRTPEGMLQRISTPEAWSAFNWGDVLNVREDELAGFGQIGGNLTQRPNEAGGLPNAFGPLSAPIIEPVTGAILPAPYKAAATLNYLRLTNPQFYQLALSAYANSLSRAGDPNARLGYSQAGLEAEMQQALPQGQEHGLIGLR